MLNIRINGEAYELTQDNCAIFTFREDKYNHLFVITGEKEGMYIFGHNDVLIQLAETGMFRMHYAPEVPECDLDQYKVWEARTQAEAEVVEESPLTEAEVDYYAKELEGRINWDELKD